jgi:exosortase A-associated hydrolase 2
MEKPLFIENGIHQLFAIQHCPDIPITTNQNRINLNKRCGIIICAPFGEEKLIAHRILVNFARSFSAQGFYCLRFDHMGHGDSSGNFEEADLKIWISDIEAIIKYARQNLDIDYIVLFGIRFGATLAYLTAGRNPLINTLLLLSPVINGADYVKSILRSNLTTQMATMKKITKTREDLVKDLIAGRYVNVDGYLLSKNLYFQVDAVDLLEGSKLRAENILLIHLQKTINQSSNPIMKQFRDFLKNQKINFTYKEVVSDNFWTDGKFYRTEYQNLNEMMFRWLINRLEEKVGL